MNKNLSLSIAAAVGLASTATNTIAELFDPIVITANRLEQTVSSSTAAVTVISAEQIAKSQPNDLLDVLKLTPGIQVTRSGSIGSNASVFIRGSNSGHALVVVDGVRIDSATLGNASLHHLNPKMIERIEIVRGANSSAWGSDAIGGVIHIFTKKGHRQTSPSLGVAYGSDNHKELRGSIEAGDEFNQFSFALSELKTNGFDSSKTDDLHTGNTSIDRDNDSYNRHSYALNGNTQLNDVLSVNLTVNRSFGENDFDETLFSYDPVTFDPVDSIASRPINEFDLLSSNLTAKLDMSEAFSAQLSVGRAVDDLLSTNELQIVPNQADDNYKTTRNSSNLQTTYSFSDDHQLIAGIDYADDKVSSSTQFDKDSRENIAGFVQYQLNVESGFGLELGARSDHNQQFGDNSTGNVGVSYHFNDSWAARANVGNAFKAPTFNDLYWPFAGNPNLNPEQSVNREVGILQYTDEQQFEVNLFRNVITDLIAWAPDNTGNWLPSNIGQADIKGAEFIFSRQLDSLSLNSSAIYLKPIDVATGLDLRRRSRWVGSLAIDQRFHQFSAGVVIQGESRKRGLDKLPGNALVDLRASWDVTPEFATQLLVENVLDKEYELVPGYNTAGLGVLVSFNYTPKL